jgi:prepilin-type N-terminal cleavage/methylation domain-containing protein
MQHRSAGFSLVEVLVAMVVFMISAAAVSSLMFHSTSFVSRNNFMSQAITCAQAALEEIRTQDYDDIVTTSGKTCSGDGVNFNVAWSVSVDDPDAGMKTINVTVSWSEKGAAKSYAIHTIYSSVTA